MILRDDRSDPSRGGRAEARPRQLARAPVGAARLSCVCRDLDPVDGSPLVTLPHEYGANHWRLAWGGFDTLGIALATTAVTTLRRSPSARSRQPSQAHCSSAMRGSTLTSSGTSDVAQAAGGALLIEPSRRRLFLDRPERRTGGRERQTVPSGRRVHDRRLQALPPPNVTDDFRFRVPPSST